MRMRGERRNASFSENFVYVLNESSLKIIQVILTWRCERSWKASFYE